jgi:hypothetical protein
MLTKTNGVNPAQEWGGTTQKSVDYPLTSVYQTREYDKFKPLHGNRQLNLAHINRLTESFKKVQLCCPIIVNEKFEVIDGQHRLRVCIDLGLPIQYMIVKNYGLPEVQVFNSNSHTWNKKDYLESYCQLGLRPYLQFRDFARAFPDFQIVVCGQILMDRQSVNRQLGTKKTGRFHSKEFEEGKLVIADLDKATRTAKKIMDFKPFYKGFARKAFVAALITIFKHKNYNHERMMLKLKKCPPDLKLVDMAKASFYIDRLENIYNARVSDNNKLFFRGK